MRLRWLFAYALALAAALMVLAPGSAAASPADVADVIEGARLTLAPAPEGFVETRRGALRVVHAPSEAEAVQLLIKTFDAHQPRLADELGQPIDGPVTVGLGRNLREMQALAPVGYPPPRYAVGVAYPASGIILLSLAGHGLGGALDLESIFVHELSHVALARATGGQRVPRWFSEGIAILQAREQTVTRVQTLLDATMKGTILPLEALDAGFSGRPFEVNVAYAQAADIVGFLEREDESGRKLARLIARLRKGDDFEEALRRSHYLNLAALELEWRRDLDSRYGTLPLVIGGSFVWGAASILLVIAYRKRRRQKQLGIERLGREEAAIERLERIAAARLLEEESRADAETLDSLPPPPPQAEDSVPTVQHEGENHTLH